MQKIADDTELKAAAERAAKERNTSTRGEQSCSTAGSDFDRSLQPSSRSRTAGQLCAIAKSTHGQGLPTKASRKKLEDMKCQTQAAHGSLQPCSVLP